MTSVHGKSLRLLLTLLFFVLVGAIVGSLLGMFFAVLFSGVSDPREILAVLENQGDNTTTMLITQAFASVGMFILPPLAMGLFDRNTFKYVDRRGRVTPILLLMTLLITLSFGPITEWLGILNQKLVLPESLAGLEQWMKSMEAQLEELTFKLLADTSLSGFLANLFVIAVLAAVGEELLFRGCLQTILQNWFGNSHLAIWVVAIIFSAIHLQFYGFLPRMALGALFGYLFFWSKNLWVPILAHFVNNSAVLVIAYLYQKQGYALSELEQVMDMPAYAYFISLLVCVSLLIIFYNKTKSQHNPQVPAPANHE